MNKTFSNVIIILIFMAKQVIVTCKQIVQQLRKSNAAEKFPFEWTDFEISTIHLKSDRKIDILFQKYKLGHKQHHMHNIE